MFVAPHIEWAALTPILILMGAGVVGVLIEAFVPRGPRRTIQVTLAALAIAGALVAVTWRWTVVQAHGPSALVAGALREDGPALVAQAVLLMVALLGLLALADRHRGEDAFVPTAAAVPGSEYEDQARRAGLTQTEVFPLTMFAVTGMTVFPAAADLLTMFIALEVLSLPLYLLTGLARRRRLLSQEASLKYFLMGAFSSAFFLMGLSLLYGYAGSVRMSDIATAVPLVTGMDGLLLAGCTLVIVGLLFKVGAVPFHAWVPDVYQGAPTPALGLLAACTKVAAFAALLRFVYVVTPGLTWDLAPMLWTAAILTMLFGTVVAIVQTDIKRMLAYSWIAHAGFVLLGVIALDDRGFSASMIYLLGYGLANVGAFALVAIVRRQDADGTVTGEASHISQWAGLGRRSPVVAVCFALFLLSFAGIPLTAGFTGKFAVFSAAVSGGAWPLVVIGVLASAAAAFFYVRIIVLMFFTEPATDEDGSTTTVVRGEGLTAVSVAVSAIGTVLIGVLPGPILAITEQASKFLL